MGDSVGIVDTIQWGVGLLSAFLFLFTEDDRHSPTLIYSDVWNKISYETVVF